MAGCGSDKSVDVANLNPDYILSAEEFYSEYQGNVYSMDEKYKNKVIQLTGTIVDIGNVFGHDCIEFDGGQFMSRVRCSFNTNHLEDLKKVEKGERVTIKGMGAGQDFLVDCCVLR
jgi:hypothetical protein